jgi:hypothetical protein
MVAAEEKHKHLFHLEGEQALYVDEMHNVWSIVLLALQARPEPTKCATSDTSMQIHYIRVSVESQYLELTH